MNAFDANSASKSVLLTVLCRVFNALGRDDTPMVKRVTASNLAALIDVARFDHKISF